MSAGRGAAVALAASLGIASGTAACGSETGPAGVDAGPMADGAAAVDALESSALEIAHVPPEQAYQGQAAVVWPDGTVVDTTALTIDGAAYPGTAGDDVAFDVSAQVADAMGELPDLADLPDLAVLHVGELHVPAGATVRVTGGRPLVIIAAGEVRLDGVLDAAAHGAEPGPGGAGPGQGLGAGQAGVHGDPDDDEDSGGGGGGYATDGGRGGMGCYRNCYAGSTDLPGGQPGAGHGTPSLAVLRGGSGGGAGGAGTDDPCDPGAGGAGGGAVQISSASAIHIGPDGGITAGGGGGAGGVGDETGCDPAAGGGGGSGGAIYLQAPVIRNQGTLAANGGSGGAGADDDVPGGAGGDGVLGTRRADAGLSSGIGAAGGRGASREGAPMPGPDYVENGGGGGGAGGRIVLRSPALDSAGIISPEAAQMLAL